MIKQTTKDRLKELGIDPEALETAIKADTEVDVTLPDGSYSQIRNLQIVTK